MIDFKLDSTIQIEHPVLGKLRRSVAGIAYIYTFDTKGAVYKQISNIGEDIFVKKDFFVKGTTVTLTDKTSLLLIPELYYLTRILREQNVL